MRARAILSDEQIHEVRKPVTRAATLPPQCYTSRDWYESEIRSIFFSEWLCIGRVEQLRQPGDFFTANIAEEPLIVNRNERGELRAHINSCRHRGMTVAQGRGNCRNFRCPYHSWVYSLDGDLLRTPGRHKPMEDIENFSCAEHGLVPVRIDTWAGFLFINFNAKALPLLSWLGDLPARLKNYGLEDMVCTREITFDIDCNWKLPVDNFLEPYHIDTVHGKHVARSMYTPEFTFEDSSGPYQAMYGMNALSNLSKFPAIEGLDSKQAGGIFHYWIIPTVKLTVASSYMKFFLIFPNGPDKHRLVCCWCFPKSTVARDDFESVVGPGYYARGTTGKRDGEWVDEIIEEDNEVLVQVQKGLKSRFATSGRYSTKEVLVHRAANYILDKVIVR